ncbi:MAG: ABC transporter substrate-binding protein, partial [Firmicutes bacterium]|nr:ABC transporter substrate-binding protein [Bacillota bacterium]
FMQDVPMIPLEYRPGDFYEFNETYWTGFPTAKNPTAPPQHDFAGTRVLFVIEPVKK